VFDEKPAAVAVGGSTGDIAKVISEMMSGDRFRPYATRDMIGVEIGGALKNIIAIAAGISDGMDLGSNARAAIITRGLGEIARFGEASGADPLTFMGLSGMGDLVLTCTDDQSRNRRFGKALARVGAVESAKNEVGELVEGVSTALAVHDMALRLGIELPLISQVAAILNGDSSPEEAVRELLARELVSEHD
jgi:glycerol-3-phosphate dehydrogenase (NAD(P)+)